MECNAIWTIPFSLIPGSASSLTSSADNTYKSKNLTEDTEFMILNHGNPHFPKIGDDLPGCKKLPGHLTLIFLVLMSDTQGMPSDARSR
jgi:hypothetical protein